MYHRSQLFDGGRNLHRSGKTLNLKNKHRESETFYFDSRHFPQPSLRSSNSRLSFQRRGDNDFISFSLRFYEYFPYESLY